MGLEKREGQAENIVESKFAEGDRVRIIDGPLVSHFGVVESVDLDKKRVSVTVFAFGRETSADLDLSQLERAD
jgi:transcriptional antiterminator NusG